MKHETLKILKQTSTQQHAHYSENNNMDSTATTTTNDKQSDADEHTHRHTNNSIHSPVSVFSKTSCGLCRQRARGSGVAGDVSGVLQAGSKALSGCLTVPAIEVSHLYG